jgi:hypothetical protein
VRALARLLPVVFLTVAWDPPLVDCGGVPSGPLTFRVYVFENRCAFDLDGAPVMRPDGFGGLVQMCHATPYRETPATAAPIDEPRLNEIFGWPGLIDQPRALPAVGAVDEAGNETRSDEGCP